MNQVPDGVVRRIVFISTYPPRHCGIATFTQDLLKNIKTLQPNLELEVFAINRSQLDSYAYPNEVTELIDQEDPDSYIQAAEKINLRAAETIVVVQHEYGIHGGEQGKHLLGLLKNLQCPIVTTLHTVLDSPSPAMKSVTKDLIAYSSKVILLTKLSLNLIQRLYPGSAEKLQHIPHGIHPTIYVPSQELKPRLKLGKRQVLLTFGLLSRNKGIEYVIEALPKIVKRFPEVIYLVVGGTHPDVLRGEGESYRKELAATVKKLALQKHVLFVNNFIPLENLLLYLQATDIYIASSLNPQQVVSGTLSYALGAGCAIVSTEFSQAKEAISSKTGRVVPIKNAAAISRAVNELLANSKKLTTMKQTAYFSTRSMLWTNVADNYLNLMATVSEGEGRRLCLTPELNLSHLETMTSKLGIAQFASGAKPSLKHGYTLDDNCRAMQLVNEAVADQPQLKATAQRLVKKYLVGIEICLSQKPPVNYLSRSGQPTHQNHQEDLEDSLARAFYGLQPSSFRNLPEFKLQVKKLFAKLPPLPAGKALRPIAFYLLGSCAAAETGSSGLGKNITNLADKLVAAYQINQSADWDWFEPVMTYANGTLSASLLEAARLTGSATYRRIGLSSLEFLIKTCFFGEVYVPIGQNGWYVRKKPRAIFDQQPEDVFATIQALLSAYKLTADKKYKILAQKAFSWFQGNNMISVRMYDDSSGGCHDGLMPEGANPDEGAESSVAYLRSRLLMNYF